MVTNAQSLKIDQLMEVSPKFLASMSAKLKITQE